ncbi:MAG: hypothetical protein AAF696_38220, partial [Bacteroidota bacterium]
MNTISCTQARGGGAMNLEWVAYDFIVQNCPGCKHHKEVTKNNFGREVLEKYDKLISKQKEEKRKDAEVMQKFDALIQQKISNQNEISKTTELSIFRKLVELKNPKSDQVKISRELFEASKISLSFFNSLSNDYLSLFFDNEQFGSHLLETSDNIIKHNNDLVSPFFIEKVKGLLSRSENLNDLIKVLPMSRLQPPMALEICNVLISGYDPDSFNRYDDFENHSPDLLEFIFSFFEVYPKKLHKLLENNLKNEEGRIRAFASLIVFHFFDSGRALKFE